MAKFKDLLKESAKEKIEEAVGGVVSTPAINSGSGVANGRSGAIRSGDSRVDTGGEFTFRADELPGVDKAPSTTDSDFSSQHSPKSAFSEEGQKSDNSIVLHEDDSGSVTLRENGNEYEVVIREGSDEKTYTLDEQAAKKVRKFFS